MGTATEVSICNSALLLNGGNEVTSLSEDSTEAKLCSSIYTDEKQSLLQSYPWRFSISMADLGGPVVTAPLFKWKYQYQLPSDFLRLLQMEEEAEYEIYGDKIYTDNSTCKIIYQANVTEQKMPAYFIVVLKMRMATLLSMSLHEDSTKFQLFEAAAQKEMMRARAVDSQQQISKQIPQKNFTFLNVRG